MSVSSLMKESQIKTQEKDYESAFSLTSQAIVLAADKPSLNLLILHATCAQNVEKYSDSVESYLAAIEKDKDRQFHQKLYKSLSDVHEKTQDWKKHADALYHLYGILKQKGNLERAAAIAETITESFEKSNQHTAGVEFVLHHLLASPEVPLPTAHRVRVMGKLASLRSSHRQTQSTAKSGSIGSIPPRGQQSEKRDTPFLERDLMSGPLFELAVSTLQETVSVSDLSPCDWDNLSGIGHLLATHMQALLCGMTSQQQTAVATIDMLSDLRRQAASVLSALQPFTSSFLPGVTVKNAPSYYVQADGVSCCVLVAIQCVAEAWCLDSNVSFMTISPHIDHVIALASVLVACPVASKIDDTFTSAHSVLCLLGSVKALHYIETGALRESIFCGAAVGAYWRDFIATQMTTTSAMDSTIKITAATSNTRRIHNAMIQNHSHLTSGLCLVICACMGATVEFRGIAMGGMTALESLCVTQHAGSVVAAVRSLLGKSSSGASNGEDCTVLLRPVLLELTPLARIRVLEGMDQHAGAVDEGLAGGYFVSVDIPGDMEDLSLSQRKRRIRQQRDDDYAGSDMSEKAVCKDKFRHLTTPVAQWVYVSLLNEMSFHTEAMSAVDYFLSSSSVQCISSWLSAEKSWALLLRAVRDQRARNMSATLTGDVLTSFGLLRDMTLPGDVCDMVVSALSGVLASEEPSVREIEASIRFRMGVAMWLGGGSLRLVKHNCIATLLSAAKCDPNMGCIYSYIGHYYLIVMNDGARAVKCYLKALAANPMDAEAGVALSQLYVNNDDAAQALKLWNDVKELSASHASWCFSLEGQYFLTLEEYDMAIEAFRKSLELNAEDANMWFGLGVSYTHLQQNTAALKSLQKAYDLVTSGGGNAIYILYVQAEVERRLGLLHEAATHFGEVCSSPHSDEVSQRGLAEVCLSLAHERLCMGWTHGASLSIAKGLAVLDSIPGVKATERAETRTSSGGDNALVLVSILKLRGDLCCFARHIGPEDAQHIVEGCDSGGSTWNECNFSYGCILEMLKQAEMCYRRILAIIESELKQTEPSAVSASYTVSRDDVVSAWYDIGCAVYYQAVVLGTAMGQGAGISESNSLLQMQCPPSTARSTTGSVSPCEKLRIALGAFFNGIKAGETPTHSGCWNGIGLCIRHNDAIRELCFVMAARIDASPTAYANISLLLILHGLDAQAKECLSALQLMEANPMHWISLGTVMERELSGDFESDGPGPSGLQGAVRVYDAYCAAIEVAKPADAWLGMAVAWMRVKGLVSADGRLVESVGTVQKRGVTDIDVKYFVEIPVKLFLHRRRVHPYAWFLLGWALTFKKQYSAAVDSYCDAVKALNISAQYVEAMNGQDQREVDNMRGTQAVRSLFSCISDGLCRCLTAARASKAGHDILLKRAKTAMSAECIPYVIQLAGTDVSSPSFDDTACTAITGVVEAQAIALCEGGKYGECLSTVWSEICRYVAVASVAETVQLIEFSCSLLRKFSSDGVAPPELVQLAGRVCDGMVDEIQSLQEGVDDGGKTLFQVVKIAVRVVCSMVQILLEAAERGNPVCSTLKLNVLLESAASYHPESDEVLRLLSSCCDHKSKSQLILQSLGMAARNVGATYDSEERFDIEQSVLCHITHSTGTESPRCRCTQSKLRHGRDIVPSYGRAVILATRDNISNGKRCSKESKRHLLRSLMYDPSNIDLWGALAGQIFSDNILGTRVPDVEMLSLPTDRTDNHGGGENETKEADHCRGCFYGDEYLSLCVAITSLKDHLRPAAWIDSSVTALPDPMLDLSLAAVSFPVDVSKARVVDSIRNARAFFSQMHYHASIEQYRQGIDELTASSSWGMHSSSFYKQLSQLWYEMGHVFSYALQPEGAEYCYGIAYEQIKSAMSAGGDSEVDVVKGYSRVVSAIAYLRKYESVKDIDYANRAKAICEECSLISAQSVRAVGSVVTAAVWLCQGKRKKCVAEVEKAKATWPQIEVPRCMFEHF